MPVRQSPLPPTAMLALPVQLMNEFTPLVISVRCPLSKTTHLVRPARSCATAIWPSRSLAEMPLSRSHSPGCGVSIRTELLRSISPLTIRRQELDSLNAFKPSASTTSGPSNFVKRFPTTESDSKLRPNPGPIATHETLSIREAILSSAAEVNRPSASHGKGSVMQFGFIDATIE